MNNLKYYYVDSNGGVQGPFAASKIIQEIQQGMITDQSLLARDEGAGKHSPWAGLATWSEFATLLPAPAPPPVRTSGPSSKENGITSWSNMGNICLAFGIVMIVYFCLIFDIRSGSVTNQGKMNDRECYVMVGGFLMVVGAIFVTASNRPK